MKHHQLFSLLFIRHLALFLGSFVFFCAPAAYGQGMGSGVLPDPFPAPPSNSNFYYQNKGQIIDELGNPHPEIKYYTEHTAPSIFLAEDKVSFVAVNYGDTSIVGVMDTLYRIDVQFICDDADGGGDSGGDNPGGGDDDIGGEEPPQDYCGDIMAYEQSQDHLNYFLPHCGAGITDVKGYARVVYHNAFPDIDVHFYSNALAPVLYFVVKPGGDPDDIKLLFSGQDSIQALGGALSMYLNEWTLDFPQAIAYEIDNTNNINMLGWLPLWDHQGGGMVKVGTGIYNPGHDLVIRVGGDGSMPLNNYNLEWSTHYGRDKIDIEPTILVEDDCFYHSLMSTGGLFKSTNGSSIFSEPNNYDIYISKFLHSGIRIWGSYYGGEDLDYASQLVMGYNNNQTGGPPAMQKGLWLGGYTYSTDVSMFKGTGNFQQLQNLGTLHTKNANGLLAFFNTVNGVVEFSTFFGAGNGIHDYITAIAYDEASYSLYIAGITATGNLPAQFNNNCLPQTNGSFPLCQGTGNKFFQGDKANSNDWEGFVAKFHSLNMDLEWSTLFGGEGRDMIKSIKLKTVSGGHEVYIGGSTQCTTVTGSYPSPVSSVPLSAFPLANPGGGAFFQTSTFSEASTVHSFIAKFNTNLRLAWGTFLGRSAGGIKNIKFNSLGNMYIVGDGMEISYAASSSVSPNLLGRIPVYDNGIAHYEPPVDLNQRTVLTKFNSNLSIKYSTFLTGGYDNNSANSVTNHNIGLDIDAEDRVFVGINVIPNIMAATYNPYGAFIQNANASAGSSWSSSSNSPASDGYIYGFNNVGHILWGTFFGGTANVYTSHTSPKDVIHDIGVYDDTYLFVTGVTRGNISQPYVVCPGGGAYCDATNDGNEDVHISRFNTSVFPGFVSVNNLLGSTLNLSVSPNPSDGVFRFSFFHSGSGDKVHLRIIDLLAREYSSFEISARQGVNNFNLDLSSFALGIYLAELSNGSTRGIVKLVKF